jgi:hypothetical protein
LIFLLRTGATLRRSEELRRRRRRRRRSFTVEQVAFILSRGKSTSFAKAPYGKELLD